jgi:tripartite-type tricarboxylate transporter receptor subunit TctC
MKSAPAIWRVAALALLACGMHSAQAQKPTGLPGNYPGKPIRIIVGSSPGGGTDIITRLVIARLGDRWGHSFVVENHASGIGGIIGMDMVVRAAPDGYTLLVTANSTVVNAALVAKTNYDVRKALAPISQFTSQPYVLAASTALPVNSVKELIAYAKAKPGELNYASSGTGSAAHIGMEQFKYIAGLNMIHVPYKGIGPGIVDMMGGRIQVLFGSVLSTMPHAKSGKIKALAVGSLQRSSLLPDIPTVAETIPGFEMIGWYGLLAPAGTPAAVINALNRDINQVLASAEVKQKLAADGAEAPQVTPEQFRATILSEIDKIAKLMKEAGLKLE